MHAEHEQMSMAEFIRSAGVSLKSERWHENPHMDGSENMDHWRCVLRAGRSRMTVYFSKGYGHNGTPPDTGEVLDCLASDAVGIDNAQGFEDWASEYGYSEDSRKAEGIYRTVERQARKLRAFLGDSAYETLLYHVERL